MERHVSSLAPRGADASAKHLLDLDQSIAALEQQIEGLLVEQGAMTERREQLRQLRRRRDGARMLRLRTEAAVEGLEGALSEIADGWFSPLEQRLESLLGAVGLLQCAKIDVHSDPMRPRVLNSGDTRDFAALSGSERALVYLCLKAALSETIGVVPFLVLDEPTVYLDPDRKRRLVRLLTQLAGSRRQLLVVTNDPWLKDELGHAQIIELERG